MHEYKMKFLFANFLLSLAFTGMLHYLILQIRT